MRGKDAGVSFDCCLVEHLAYMLIILDVVISTGFQLISTSSPPDLLLNKLLKAYSIQPHRVIIDFLPVHHCFLFSQDTCLLHTVGGFSISIE